MSLRDRRILLVEDEYLLAIDVQHELEHAGAIVLGPEPSVPRALGRIARENHIDAAILDVNLGNEPVFRVAHALSDLNVPFVFASGYEDGTVTAYYPQAINCRKPLDPRALIRALGDALTR